MEATKRKRLEAAGFRVGTVQEFLGLSDAEMRLIDMKLALAKEVRARRVKAGLSQAALARRIGSSQSRVARLENSDPETSLDLLIRAVLALGATQRQVGRVIGKAKRVA